MSSINKQQPKIGMVSRLYESMLQRMGNKRFYPNIQRIENRVKHGSTDIDYIPSNRSAFIGILELLVAIIIRTYQKLFWAEQWYLLYSFDEEAPSQFEKFKPLIPPRDRFWADPNLIKRDNRYYIFIEEYFYKKQRGCLSVIELDKLGNHKEPIPILEKEHHLSYPFIFQFEDKYFMVPESADHKTIDLYECTGFPDRWQFVMHLMTDVTAVDSTLFRYINKWWLFTAMPGKFEALPKVGLFLFYSDELLTNHWEAHPQNPVIPDNAYARPAGGIFTRDGKFYRPSQDTTNAYGSGIFINEITTLSEDVYSETRVASIKPNWDKKVKGTHTYSHADQLTVIDVYRRLPKILIQS
jgi:hypothetical protein